MYAYPSRQRREEEGSGSAPGRHAPGSVADASDGRAAPSIEPIESFALLVLKPSALGAGDPRP